MSDRFEIPPAEQPAAPVTATEPTDLGITITPTCYQVAALPESDRAAPACTITVEYRPAAGVWVICRLGECLARDGTWHPEPCASQRNPAWWTTCGYDLHTALHVAARVLPGLPACIHGMTVAQVVERRRRR